jgi:hypothetical protein
MYMRKYGYLAAAAGAALVLSVPAGVAVAANVHKAPKAVLTIGKVNGTPVKDKAVLKASLPKGGKVILAIGSHSVACTSSSIEAKVVKNPAKAGEATLSVTSVSVSKCGKVLGFSLSLKSLDLPAGATIKTSKGDPVTLSEASKSKPLGFEVSVDTGSPPTLCFFNAASISGHASNKANTVSFSKQPFKLDSAKSGGACSIAGTTATFTATYGPIVDSSVKHSPKVFIS